MDRWVRHLAKQVAAGGLCLTVLAGMLQGLGPLEVLLRGVVIGLVLYFAIVLVGGLIGQALLRLAVEEHEALAQSQKAQAKQRAVVPESEDDDEEDEESEEPKGPGGNAASGQDEEGAA